MKARALKGHTKNTNKGTERGAIQLQRSVEKYGFGRSIVVDKNGVAVAGNHLLDVAQEKDVPVITVETTGRELVVVKRLDFDLADPADKRAVEYAVVDNRTAEVNLQYDTEQILAEIRDGADLSEFMRPDELVDEMEKQDSPDQPPAGDFTVKLKFTQDQSVKFSVLVAELSRQYAVTTLPEVVLKALEAAAG